MHLGEVLLEAGGVAPFVEKRAVVTEVVMGEQLRENYKKKFLLQGVPECAYSPLTVVIVVLDDVFVIVQ